jgi:hypothetical protein
MKIISVFSVPFFLGVLVCAPTGRAADTSIVEELTAKGATLTDSHGTITGFDLADLSKWSESDFGKIAELKGLQKLSFGKGLSDGELSRLTQLTEVTSFTTNGAELDDDGVRQLARFKKLQVLTFFHPGKGFTGIGLADLSALADLESLTVAGTSVFGNEGMASIARLSHLKSLRVFHCNADSQGVALLKDLDELHAVTLGQRLSYMTPTMVADDTIGLLLSFKSLESISLSEARISVAALVQLKQLPRLTRLTLDDIDLPEADVDKLRRELPGVQIRWTAPSAQAAKRIKSLFGQN